MTAIVAFDPEFTERSMSAFVGISPEAAGLQSTPKARVTNSAKDLEPIVARHAD